MADEPSSITTDPRASSMGTGASQEVEVFEHPTAYCCFLVYSADNTSFELLRVIYNFCKSLVLRQHFLHISNDVLPLSEQSLECDALIGQGWAT